MVAMLRVDDVSVSIGGTRIISGISFELRAGEVLAIIGPNGAGKSTLLGAVMGLLPCTGRLRYAGADLAAAEVEARVARGVCLVPERRELFGELSVEDNLRLGAFQRVRNGERGADSDFEAVYARFPRLHERRTQLAATLSGGERQMLALGRALMGKPRLLMLDEPSLGLAPRIVREIMHIVADLRTTGVSILLVEQNARAALQVADHGYVLETGDIALAGTSAELSGNPKVVESYLGLAGRANEKKEMPA